MFPRELARLGKLSEAAGKAPSQYLGLTGTDAVSLYWQWCIDVAVIRSLKREREEQKRKEREEGYEEVVPE